MRVNVALAGLIACSLGAAAARSSTSSSIGNAGAAPAITPTSTTTRISVASDTFVASKNVFTGPTQAVSWGAPSGTLPSIAQVNLVMVMVVSGASTTNTIASATPSANNGAVAASVPTSSAVAAPSGQTNGVKRQLDAALVAEGLGLAMRDDEPLQGNTGEISASNPLTGYRLTNVLDSSVVIDAAAFTLGTFNSGLPFPPMLYLKIDWRDGSVNGASYSPLFYMTNGQSLQGAPLISDVDGSKPARPEDSSDSNGVAAGTQTSAGASSTSSTPGQTSAAAVPSSGDGAPAGSGLSNGAIAGIAVGAGVGGLLIIGLVAWFFWRRRKNQRGGAHYPVGYSSDGHVDANASGKWDKELPMVTSDSPQSRFAPADAARLQDQRSSMVASGHHDDESASFAPYSDRDAMAERGLSAAEPDATTSRTDLHESTARSPTPPSDTRYAHLVEEGMTEDEIQRLEEEERALDAAIEDAGRASRAA